MRNIILKRIRIIVCILLVAFVVASIIVLCVYSRYSMGVDITKVNVSVDGEPYATRIEVKEGSTHEITIEHKQNFDYYLCVDSEYGYINDNKVVHIKDGLQSATLIPIRVVIVKQNYAIREFICQLLIEPI